MEATLACVRIFFGGRNEPNCCEMAPIPSAGSEIFPDANIRKTNSAIRLDVVNSASKNTPPRNGRKKPSIIEAENPKFFRYWSVEVSGRVKRSGIEPERDLWRNLATRNLSENVPIGTNSDWNAEKG